MKRSSVYILSLTGALVVISAAVPPAVRWYRHRQWIAWTRSDDAQRRAKAFDGIARHEIQAGAEDVLHALATEQDRYALSCAAYAAARLGLAESVPLLRERIGQPPIDPTTAELMCCLVRAADGQAGSFDPWLTDCLDSDAPWKRVGAAAALLESGDPRGGTVLLDLLDNGPRETAPFAYYHLRATAEPLAITLGHPVDWPASAETFVQSGQADRFGPWWRAHVSPQTVADVWQRLRHRDHRWREMDRLTSGRNHLARWMGLGS